MKKQDMSISDLKYLNGVKREEIHKVFDDYLFYYSYEGKDWAIAILFVYLNVGIVSIPILQMDRGFYLMGEVERLTRDDLSWLEAFLQFFSRRINLLTHFLNNDKTHTDYVKINLSQFKEICIKEEIDSQRKLGDHFGFYEIMYHPNIGGSIYVPLIDTVARIPFHVTSMDGEYEVFSPEVIEEAKKEDIQQNIYFEEQNKKKVEFILENQRLRMLF